jgi:hypothetical protein
LLDCKKLDRNRYLVLPYARQHTAPYPQLPAETPQLKPLPDDQTLSDDDDDSIAVGSIGGVNGGLAAVARDSKRLGGGSRLNASGGVRRGLLHMIATQAQSGSTLRLADSVSSLVDDDVDSVDDDDNDDDNDGIDNDDDDDDDDDDDQQDDDSVNGTSSGETNTNVPTIKVLVEQVDDAATVPSEDDDVVVASTMLSVIADVGDERSARSHDDDEDQSDPKQSQPQPQQSQPPQPQQSHPPQIDRPMTTTTPPPIGSSPNRIVGGGVGGEQALGRMGGPLWERSLDAGCWWGGVRHATPVVLQRAVHYLNTHERALHTEGLFRIAGNHRLLATLRKQFDAGVDVELSAECGDDVHTVASLLINYLRHATPPLVPPQQRTRFIAAANVPRDVRLRYVRVLLATLPPSHQRSLDLLCSFLRRVAANHLVTHMDIRNLAMVFGPCFLRQKKESDDPMAMVLETSAVNDVVALLIEQHAKLFGTLIIIDFVLFF